MFTFKNDSYSNIYIYMRQLGELGEKKFSFPMYDQDDPY